MTRVAGVTIMFQRDAEADTNECQFLARDAVRSENPSLKEYVVTEIPAIGLLLNCDPLAAEVLAAGVVARVSEAEFVSNGYCQGVAGGGETYQAQVCGSASAAGFGRARTLVANKAMAVMMVVYFMVLEASVS